MVYFIDNLNSGNHASAYGLFFLTMLGVRWVSVFFTWAIGTLVELPTNANTLQSTYFNLADDPHRLHYPWYRTSRPGGCGCTTSHTATGRSPSSSPTRPARKTTTVCPLSSSRTPLRQWPQVSCSWASTRHVLQRQCPLVPGRRARPVVLHTPVNPYGPPGSIGTPYLDRGGLPLPHGGLEVQVPVRLRPDGRVRSELELRMDGSVRDCTVVLRHLLRCVRCILPRIHQPHQEVRPESGDTDQERGEMGWGGVDWRVALRWSERGRGGLVRIERAVCTSSVA